MNRPVTDGLGTCRVCRRYTNLKGGACSRRYCKRILKRMRIDKLRRR